MTPIDRRSLLRGAVGAAAASATLAGASGCHRGATPTSAPSPSANVLAPTADNPFAVVPESKVEALVFEGGYGIDYVQRVGKLMAELPPRLSVKVTGSTRVGVDVQQRITDKNLPDLVDNTGKEALALSSVVDRLEDLMPLVHAKNLEGRPIRETLYPGALSPGMVDGKLAVLNYVMTVYGWWYSGRLMAQHGFTVPKTWDEAHQLGLQARAKGLWLFCWGRQASTYVQSAAIASAVKQGGRETLLALENLERNCWRQAPVQKVFTAIKRIVDAGLVRPDGAKTDWLDAQKAWSEDRQVLLYPCGSWLANETRGQVADDFDMRVAPDLALDAKPALGTKALHATSAEGFFVPSAAKNPAGGKELLRVMCSLESATEFTREKLTPTIVRGTVPPDAHGSSALSSQVKLLEDAGEAVFNWKFVDYYGTTTDQVALWNAFLSGRVDVATLTDELQKITDVIRNDPAVHKYSLS